MPRKLHALVFAALSLTLLGPATAAEDAEEAIRSQLDRFEEAFNAGKGADVGAFYTQDAIAFPPGSPRVEGREAIGKLWQSVIDSGAKDLQLEALEVGEGSEDARQHECSGRDGEDRGHEGCEARRRPQRRRTRRRRPRA